MSYRRHYRAANPQPRNMTIKYAGKCACCGGEIKAGEWATYYPPGTIAGWTKGAIGHCGGLEGDGLRCTIELRKQHAVNSYAGDGLDERYEDQCRDICGL